MCQVHCIFICIWYWLNMNFICWAWDPGPGFKLHIIFIFLVTCFSYYFHMLVHSWSGGHFQPQSFGTQLLSKFWKSSQTLVSTIRGWTWAPTVGEDPWRLARGGEGCNTFLPNQLKSLQIFGNLINPSKSSHSKTTSVGTGIGKQSLQIRLLKEEIQLRCNRTAGGRGLSPSGQHWFPGGPFPHMLEWKVLGAREIWLPKACPS